MTASDFPTAVTTLLSTQEYLQALGWAFAIAIIIGGILNDGYRQLITWLLAISLYTLLLEFTRASYFEATNNSIYVPEALALVTTLDIFCGLATGWLIAFLAKANVKRTMVKEILEKEAKEAKEK